MTEHILVVEGLRKQIGGVEVLMGIDTRLRRGGITAFVGPNGSGKTTLFNTLTGELKPDAGRVLFEGRDLGKCQPWQVASRGVGKIFQDVRVFPGLSVLENVVAALIRPPDRSVGRSLIDGPRRIEDATRQAEKLLDSVGLEAHPGSPAAELSWGNQKLLAFARLLAGDFRLVLLDEPVAGLSPVLVDRLKTLMRNMARHQGVTIALIEHDMSFVADLADAVVVLQAGKIWDQGPTDAVLQRPENVELCLGL